MVEIKNVGFQSVLFHCLETETSVMLTICFSAISLELLPCVQVYYREEEAFKDNFLQRNRSTFHRSSNEPHWNTIEIPLYVCSWACPQRQFCWLRLELRISLPYMYVAAEQVLYQGFCFLLNCKCLEPRSGSWLKFLAGRMSSEWQRQI